MVAAQQAMAATQQAQYEMLLAEHNAHYAHKVQPIIVNHKRHQQSGFLRMNFSALRKLRTWRRRGATAM
jgi:hypothetical protein